MPQSDRYRHMAGGRFVEFSLQISISLHAYPIPTLIFYSLMQAHGRLKQLLLSEVPLLYIHFRGWLDHGSDQQQQEHRRRPCVLSIISNPSSPHSLDFALLRRKKRKAILHTQTVESTEEEYFAIISLSFFLRSFKLLVSHWFKLLKDELSPTKPKDSGAYLMLNCHYL